ncbi:MAG: RNA polymerase subunit sigma-70 [Bryobacteraceae bacterium]|nr:RNA polymerase subunit sigma-70 [Bryobacteraceae bacterium]
MGHVTQLLQEWREGNRQAENELFSLVLPDLRRLAQHLIQGERQGHSLQATELVDQIYFRLVAARDREWHSRGHFYAIAGRAMRRLLIDHARARPAGEKVALEPLQDFLPANSADINVALTVDQLMERMEAVNPSWCTLVELKYFLGLTDDEAAEVLGMKVRSLQRMWLEARKWLFQQIRGDDATEHPG